MTFKIIARKTREPELRKPHISRRKITGSLAESFSGQKKSVCLVSITGYGKTFAVREYLQEHNLPACWYNLDEWDKDPVTFLNYLYSLFRNRGLLSDDLAALLAQPGNDEKYIKNFIGLLSNELEENLKESFYLVLDNFHEIQDEEIIQQIMVYLLNYCPEYLKIIIISRKSMPEIFFPYFLKHEMKELEFNDLLLSREEASIILDLYGNNEPEFCQALLNISQKNISLFMLLAQNYNDRAGLEKYSENRLFSSVAYSLTSQIFGNFSENLKNFISHNLFFPKVKEETAARLLREDYEYYLKTLQDYNVLFAEGDSGDYALNQSFLPVFQEYFFDLPAEKRGKVLERVSRLSFDTPEVLITVFSRAKDYDRLLEYLSQHYEYYFRHYLYNTIEALVESLKKVFPDNKLVSYLEIRLNRSTGNIGKALKVLQQQDQPDFLLQLEEGLCLTASGKYESAIRMLEELGKNHDFKITEQIALLNCLGVCYMNIHRLPEALDYFRQALEFRTQLISHHDLLKVHHNIGLIYTWQGDFNNALAAYRESMALARELNVFPLVITINNMAVIYNQQGDFNKAYETCLEALQILEKQNNILGQTVFYLTLAEAYRGLKNSFKTREFFQFLEDFLEKYPNHIYQALLLRQRAHAALEENQPEKARDFINRAFHTWTLTEGGQPFIEYKMESGIVNYHSGLYREAAEDLHAIEESLRQGGRYYHLARCSIFLAMSYLKLDEKTEYEKYYKQADEIIREKDYPLLAGLLADIGSRPEAGGQPLPEKLVMAEKLSAEVKEQSASNLVITTFGPMEVSYGGREVAKKEWKGKQPKLILLYLLLNKTGARKEQLFDMLFPDGDKNRSALHVLIRKLRGAVRSVYDQAEVISYSNDLYHFNFSVDYWWDAARFEFMLSQAREQEEPQKYRTIANALDLYKNHFMQGFELESWILSTQEHYRRLAFNAFDELCEYYDRQGEYEKMVETASRYFLLDTCNEAACRYKIAGLMAMDRKREALQEYSILEKALAKILCDEPSPGMKEFVDALGRG